MDSDGPALVRRYYEALDAGDYDDLDGILAPSFVQHRPDRTFEGRDAFVRFMREERPLSDTRHDLDTVFGADGRVAATGRVVDSRGEPVVSFADLFEIDGERIERLETYTR